MNDRLERLRNRFKEKLNNKGGGFDRDSINYGSDLYPFWKMNDGETAIIRFIPDANKNNPDEFLVEELSHSLKVGDKYENFLCPKTHGKHLECPVCALSAQFYDAGDKVSGKNYYRKKQTIARALVLKDPLPKGPNGETFEGRVVTVRLGWELLNKLMYDIANSDIQDVIYDYDNGYNFIIGKTPKDDHSTYTIASHLDHKPTSIPHPLREMITEIDLRTVFKKELSLDEIRALLDAHLTGAPLANSTQQPAQPVQAAPAQQPVQQAPMQNAAVQTPTDTPQQSSGDDDIDKLLASMR